MNATDACRHVLGPLAETLFPRATRKIDAGTDWAHARLVKKLGVR